MKFLKKLFGSSDETGKAGATAADAVEYKQFSIVAAPLKEGSQFKTAGRIIFEQDGESKQSQFIRADNHSTLEAAQEHSINKAKQIIDELGEALLEREHC